MSLFVVVLAALLILQFFVLLLKLISSLITVTIYGSTEVIVMQKHRCIYYSNESMEQVSKKARENGQRILKIAKFIQCQICNSVMKRLRYGTCGRVGSLITNQYVFALLDW